MATVQCTRCTAERKGFRRELDSWRHRLIHCVGFESILEGIYGPMLLRDLNLFNDCEPEEVDDWSQEASCSQCSFCNLPLDKLNGQVPAPTSPLSSPSDYSPCQTSTISESSQSAHKFLQAVFHKKDVSLDCDSNIPAVAQDLMKKMIHQFAVEYASKCLLRSSTNGVTRPSSPLSETSDGPLDLTVSRTQEERESKPEAEGVLDLSNRNSSNSSALSSSSQRASGSRLASVPEDRDRVGQRGIKSSALDAVLRSLCSAHRSLLYQILKLAHQENLHLILNQNHVHQTESHCCQCGVCPQDNATPHPVLFIECEAHDHSLYCPSTDCNYQGHCSLRYQPGDSKSTCSIHHQPLKDCNSEGQQGASCGCMQRCRMETYSARCSQRPYCSSCHTGGCINNTMSSLASSPLVTQTSLQASSSKLCSSVHYKQHNSHSCSYCSHHICLRQVRNTLEIDLRDGDGCSTLNREQSPSPPRLSPIPSDISKKTNEKPPHIFHHRQGEEADLINKNSPASPSHMTAGVDAATENELPCKTQVSTRTEQNPGGTLLQDVMNRFSQKLENITPLDKDPTLVSTAMFVSEKEQSQFPSTSQNLQFHADAHLTEIITTVLHTGNASDYNLSELFNRHDNKEPKSPNTRARRRHEIQIAIATPADNASARRQTLELKRKFAMLDPSFNRRKTLQAKKARLEDRNVSVMTSSLSSGPNLVKEVSNRETEIAVEPVEDHRVMEKTLNLLSIEHEREDVREKILTDTVKEEVEMIKRQDKEGEILQEENKLAIYNAQHLSVQQNKIGKQGPKANNVHTEEEAAAGSSVKKSPSPFKGNIKSRRVLNHESHKEDPLKPNCYTESSPEKTSCCPVRAGPGCQSDPSGAVRRSTRHIVPPQRFNSYVTWHAPIFHVSFKDADAVDTNPESRTEAPLSLHDDTEKHTFESTQKEPHDTDTDLCHVHVQTVAVKIESPEKPIPETDGSDCRRLRSSSKKLQASKTSQSPIKNGINIRSTCVGSQLSSQVQYISPVKLMFVSKVKDKEGVKYSLKSAGSGSSTQAEESFDPCEESSWAGTPHKHKSPRKSVVSPIKSAISPVKSAASPVKSVPSPGKSASSPKSLSSSPKSCSRRSGDGTPSKRLSEPESHRSPGAPPSICEITPPKRRPGRPKKLGPQPEQRAKRPIGRPPKQKTAGAVVQPKKGPGAPEEDNVVKNLKITVLYGRSRRNKRMVSESFDQLQKDFSDTCQPEGVKKNLAALLHHSKSDSGSIKTTSKKLNFVSPVKELGPQSSSNIKVQKQAESALTRKPGRPAKVKISGISITVTTVSPRQRKILMNKTPPETQPTKKALLQEFQSETEPSTINCPLSKSNQTKVTETKSDNKNQQLTQRVSVRQSMRERKPSVHFLNAVASSRSYSCSNALLRRSKKLLLTKASYERKQEEQLGNVGISGDKRQLGGQKKESFAQDLRKVAGVSLDSIFNPKETVCWWPTSAEEKTTNQELARRIRVLSDTWVSDTADHQEKEPVLSSPLTRKAKKSSVIRTLFDCLPNKPRSCSMQQICSWFMQTTETQSLSIVKKASSRNPYELMHFPRSVNNQSICHSPQAERLRRHIKKFAKTVPKSPQQHQQAQKRLRKTRRTHRIKRQLFISSFAVSKRNRGAMWWRCTLSGRFWASLVHARTRFLTRKEKERWRKKQRNRKIETSSTNRPVGTCEHRTFRKALYRSAKAQFSDCVKNSSPTSSGNQTQECVDGQKEKLCSKTWSPEKLKECRVFLRKINSPGNESAEEWDSCTVTLDDGSPSAYLFERKERGLEGVVKAVKSEQKRSMTQRTASRDSTGSGPKLAQKHDVVPVRRQRRKHRHAGVVSPELPQQPPGKTLRQSRMRGLSGPRWCDFVFEN